MKVDSHPYTWQPDTDPAANPSQPAPSPQIVSTSAPAVFSETSPRVPNDHSARRKRETNAPPASGTPQATPVDSTNTSLSDYLHGLGDLSSLTPATPYDYAYQVLKEEVPKRWGVTVDPDRIVYVRDETRIDNATYENPDGTGSHRALYPGPTLTQVMIENRQDLRNYILLGHGPEKITYSFREVKADGSISDEPLPIPVRAFTDFVWNTNFAQSYDNQVGERFAQQRPAMETITRGSMLHEAERLGQGVSGESTALAKEARGIVFAAMGYDPATSDWSTLTAEGLGQARKPLPGISVRPLTIGGKQATDVLVMHKAGSQATVLYAPGHGMQVFPNQAALVGYIAQQARDPQKRDALAAHFRADDRLGNDGSEAVDAVLARLGEAGRDVPTGTPRIDAQEWERTYKTVGLGGPMGDDLGKSLVDRLEERYRADGRALITSDADYTRRRATAIWNKIRARALPFIAMAASMLPGGSVLGPLLTAASGLVSLGIGEANRRHGKNPQERGEGDQNLTEGGQDLFSAADGLIRGAALKPGIVLKSPKNPQGLKPIVRKPSQKTPPKATNAQPGLDTRILNAAGNGRVHPKHIITDGNHVTGIQVGGDAIFESQANLIKNAQHEVLIQTFAWDPTSPGAQKILDSLMAIQTKPGTKVKVRLLVDESAGLAKKFMQLTSNNTGGGAARWPSDPDALIGNFKRDPNFKYRPLLDKLDFEVRVHQHGGANAMHGKMVVVDNRYAATTGANVQSRNHGPNPAYDMGVTLDGPAAEGMRDAFVYNWNKSINPDQKTSALPETYEFPPRTEAVPAGQGQRIAVVTRPPNANPLVKSVQNPQNQAFLGVIESAEREISVMTPNLNADDAIDALAKAADRGVKVRIIVSKEFNDARVGKVFGGGTNAEAIARLKAKTKHPENLDVRYFQNPGAPEGADVPSGNAAGNGASHAKLMIVDGKTAIVGSANMDNSSWYYAGELNLVIQSPDTVGQLNATVFEPAWARSPSA